VLSLGITLTYLEGRLIQLRILSASFTRPCKWPTYRDGSASERRGITGVVLEQIPMVSLPQGVP
jgi:hypothetical protein